MTKKITREQFEQLKKVHVYSPCGDCGNCFQFYRFVKENKTTSTLAFISGSINGSKIMTRRVPKTFVHSEKCSGCEY